MEIRPSGLAGAFYSPDGYNLYRSGIQQMATKSVVAGMAVSSKMESEIPVVGMMLI